MELKKSIPVWNGAQVKEGLEDSAKTATNYISADSTGVMVSDQTATAETPSTATAKNVLITSGGVEIRDGQDVKASFGDTVTIGDPSAGNVSITADTVGIKTGDDIRLGITGDTGSTTDQTMLISEKTYRYNGEDVTVGASIQFEQQWPSGQQQDGATITLATDLSTSSENAIMELYAGYGGWTTVDFKVGDILKNGKDYIHVETFTASPNFPASGSSYTNWDIRLSGYTPIGVVGAVCSNGNVDCRGAYLYSVSSARIYWHNRASSAQSGTLTLWVLYLAN